MEIFYVIVGGGNCVGRFHLKIKNATKDKKKRLKHWKNPSLKWQRPLKNLLLIIASDTRVE